MFEDHGKRRAADRQPFPRARHACVRRAVDRFLAKPGKPAHGVLTIAGEVTWVNYSRLREDFVTHQAQGSQRAEDFFIEDGIEVHIGVEVTKPG